MFCSNGLVGVEDDDGLVCCEAQCGRCGGSQCGGLPGGPVSWCLAIFVSYLSYHVPLANLEVLFVVGLENRESSRVPRPQPMVWLPFCRKGTLLRPANIGKFDEQIVELTTYSTLPSKHAVYEAKLYDDEQYFMGNELTPASHVRFGTQYPTH